MKASIIGAGTWGTALGILLAHNGHEVTIWSKFQQEVDALQETRRHKDLPGAVIPESMCFSSDLEAALKDQELVVLAVPSIFVRATAHEMKPYVGEGQVIVSVAKGIEEGTLYTMSDIIEEEILQADVAVLSGPSHAEEVSRFIPTTIVTGAHTEKTALFVQNAFMCDCFRVYINPDFIGVQLGGAVKNVIAIGAGMSDGIGFGANARTALITRGLVEMSRLGAALGADPETFMGMAGLGDLVLTCTDNQSRNRRFGMMLGQGMDVQSAQDKIGQVVEGYRNTKEVRVLAQRLGVEMPITEEIYQVLYCGKIAREAALTLLGRARKDERSSN